MIIELTNSHVAERGRPLAIDSEFIVSVRTIFDGETRVTVSTGEEYIVEETYEQICSQWRAAKNAA